MTTYQIPLYRQRMVAQGALRNAQGAGEAAASSGMVNVANERLARALAPAMEGLTRIEFNQAQSRQESLYAEVKAEAVKRTMTLHEGLAREALAEDTDYTTHKERSSACIVDIKKYAAEQFKGRPHLQQRFNSEVGPYIMSQDFDVRRNAVKGIAAQQIEGLGRRIQDSAAAYSLDETNNELMLSGTMQEIDRLHAAGTLSPSGAEAAKAKAWQTHDDAVIRRAMEKDPEGLMQAIQNGSDPAGNANNSAGNPLLTGPISRLSPERTERLLTQVEITSRQREKARRDADKAQREALTISGYNDMRGQIVGLEPDEQDSAFRAMSAKVQDPATRERFETMWNKDREAETIRRKTTDANVFTRFREHVTSNGLNYSQALAQLQDLKQQGLSDGGETQLRALLERGFDTETQDNIAKTGSLYRLVDEGKLAKPDQVDAYAFESGLTGAQTTQIKAYLEQGGPGGAWWQAHAKVNSALKYYNKNMSLENNPDFFEQFRKTVEPGQKLTTDSIRKTVQTMLVDGERTGGGWNYGADMTYAQALAAGHRDTWLPSVGAKDSNRIMERFRQQGVPNPTVDEIRWARRRELGIPEPAAEISVHAQSPAQSQAQGDADYAALR